MGKYKTNKRTSVTRANCSHSAQSIGGQRFFLLLEMTSIWPIVLSGEKWLTDDLFGRMVISGTARRPDGWLEGRTGGQNERQSYK